MPEYYLYFILGYVTFPVHILAFKAGILLADKYETRKKEIARAKKEV